MAKAASSPPGKYGALLLKMLPLPLACFPLWLILSNIHDAVFALHNDTLDALYLLTQVGAVYAAMLYLAWVGTLLFTKRANVTWRDMGFAPYRVHFWSILWFVISFVYLVVFNIIWQVISTYWHIDLLNRNTLLTNYTDMPLSQWSMVLIIGAIGPLGEEVLFRGLLFRVLDVVLTRYLVRHLSKSLASYIALIFAVCISAGVFATLHFDASSFPVYFAIGAVLALWVRYTRSLWPSWVLHMTFNSLFIARLLVH
ncbi:hypothetical protein KSF_079430 [Reticulibacter mediterranei]|uniref:CAAX prenyl protease 2/Lysostaphin resistance protein A-like domain-containing protein n=1 Tax=Reticulibacter mediterranei TaxID=2778369 RepID=A0A8J3IST1_9CHLR|nr:CPBP family intramembrane glutamic endopeptidase [Reticulibacter mediterranei]GHO97895.1 hypothetical protein KSF_079430 [Reticulibacter mediterranei]